MRMEQVPGQVSQASGVACNVLWKQGLQTDGRETNHLQCRLRQSHNSTQHG
jgi:hypothetical protein